MIEVVAVQFYDAGKIYYFKPCEEGLSPGDKVIVDTEKGQVVGKIMSVNKSVPLEDIVLPLKEVLRKLTPEDEVTIKALKEEEKEALRICGEKIREHGLPMKLIEAQYAFNKGYLMFFFSAEGRVDFRALVKDLAKIFRTRIELRQIGVRDMAKKMGGVGICGRNLCCSTWLREFDSISIKMSKAQYLSLNPNKMSGVCGRLMCCLRYEEEVYKALTEEFPEVDTAIMTPSGKGRVKGINIFSRQVSVHLDSGEESFWQLDELTSIDANSDAAKDDADEVKDEKPEEKHGR